VGDDTRAVKTLFRVGVQAVALTVVFWVEYIVVGLLFGIADVINYVAHPITMIFLFYVLSYFILYKLDRHDSLDRFSSLEDISKRIDRWFGNPQNGYPTAPGQFLNRPSVIIGISLGALLFVLFVYLPNS